MMAPSRRSVVVTGAGSGAAARTPCCLRGDAVIVNDMRKDAAVAVAAEIMEPGDRQSRSRCGSPSGR